MLRKHMAACLMITALTAAPALAQAPSGGTDRPVAQGSGSNAAGSPSMNPGTSMGAGTTGGMSAPSNSTMGASPTPPATSTTAQSGSSSTSQGTMPPAGGMAQQSSPSSSASAGSFIQQQQSGQMMASKLIGTSVVSQDNESIGDVNDVLLARDGRAVGIVVGVGGFLGIGEKSVAIPFDRVEFTSRSQGQSADTSTTGSGASNLASSNTSGSASTTGGSGAANQSNPSTTGSTNASTGSSSSSSSEPDRIMVKMTKNDLQQAPAFQTADRARSNESTSGGSSTTRAPNPNPSTGSKP